jgi:hypothetical protein
MAVLSTMRPFELRHLTAAERGLARTVFGRAIDLDRIQVMAVPYWNRAFVPTGWLIVWPTADALADFGANGTPLYLQARLIHELTHVWQAQQGVNLLLAKLHAGDGPAAYVYDLERDPGFARLNIEQQAMAVEHAFLCGRGVRTPHTAEVYRAALPDWGQA